MKTLESTNRQEVTRGAGHGNGWAQSHHVPISPLVAVIPHHPWDALGDDKWKISPTNFHEGQGCWQKAGEQGAAQSPSAVGQGEEEEEEEGPRAITMAVCRSSGGFPWQPQAQGAHHT